MLKSRPNYASHAARRPTTAALALTLAAVGLFTSAAQADDYVAPTYLQQKFYVMSSGLDFRVPVMTGFVGAPVPWSYDLRGQWPNMTFAGKYLREDSPDYDLSFGLSVFDGPDYPGQATNAYPAGVFIVEYSITNCVPIPEFLNTPLPPAWQDAKADADTWCATTCGVGFEMSDFDMNQWRYGCWADTSAGTAYNVAAWGGTRCEKLADNGLIQPCNPLQPLIDVRQHLGQPVADCPDCDLDQDGQITLTDLTLARNVAFGPLKVGEGETHAVLMNSGSDAHTAMTTLTQWIEEDQSSYGTYLEITEWETGISIDCADPDQHLPFLDDLTISDHGQPTEPGQAIVDFLCQLQGFTLCASNSMMYSIGHCRIGPDGVHRIRISLNCMKCV